MKLIDIKSMFIGILETILVMVLLGQSNFKEQYDIECVIAKVLGTEAV